MRFIMLSGALLAMSLLGHAQIPLSERQALIDLYEATQGDDWYVNTGWKDEDGTFRPHGTEHEWFGVIMDPSFPHVLGISFFYNNLIGKIPASIGDLKELRNFCVSGSQLEEFPMAVLTFQHLGKLFLDGSGLSGAIPEALGEMQTLKFLNLAENAFSGPVPESLSQLTNLFQMVIHNNALTQLPDLSTLDQMNLFEAQQNRLSGPVPAWIAGADQLTRVNLSGNQLMGAIPAALGNLERPLLLNLSDNLIDHFPKGKWGPGFELLLNENLLTEDDCDALNAAFEVGTRLAFFSQKTGLLPCDVMALRQSLPWVSNIAGEWVSRVVVFNPTNQFSFVQFIHPEQESLPLLEIRPNSHETVPLPELDSGYQLEIHSDNPHVFASYFVAGQRSPSGQSPAMTHGRRPDEGSAHLVFPVLPGSLKAAFAIQAAEARGETALVLRLYGNAGLLGTAALTLQDDLPKALLIPTIFPEVPTEANLALEIQGPPETKLLGTAFAFNDLNEPAMMAAVSFEQASDDWMFPWAATNDQFLSRISVFNPSTKAVKTSIQAVTPQGEKREVERTIPAQSHASFETGELFPSFRGYALRLTCVDQSTGMPQKVFANIQVGNREDRESGSSPALAPALDPSKLSSVVVLPLPTLEDIPAIVLQAPFQTEPLEVILTSETFPGDRILGRIMLEGGKPKPVLLETLEQINSERPHLINAVSTTGEPIAGSVFYFNDFREPSMTQGLNRSWFDLSVSLNYQSENSNPLTVWVENEGPLSSPEGIEVVLKMGDLEIHRSRIPPLGIGERRAVSMPTGGLDFNGFEDELIAKILLPPEAIDREMDNNQARISLQSTVSLAQSYRLSKSRGAVLTGLLHADESTFEVFFSQLVLMPMDRLTWDFERLLVDRVGSFQDLDYQFTESWQPATAGSATWHAEDGVMRISGLEEGAVYRLTVGIDTVGGERIEASQQIGLSKSAFPKTSMEIFEQPGDVRKAPRVFHPFDDRNWVQSALNIGFSETSLPGDDLVDGFALNSSAQEIREASGFGLAEDYILELSEGLYDLGFLSLILSPHEDRGALPVRLRVQGAGNDKTLITDFNLEPILDPESHHFSSRDRMTVHSFDGATFTDFSFWGAIPGEETPMEVSGRPNREFRGVARRPYEWFAIGLGITNVNEITVDQVDFRFHSIGLALGEIRRDDGGTEPNTRLSNLKFSFCDSGLVLRDMNRVQVGPNLSIHHVSSQGILANLVDDLVIENAHVEGARHRGINLDRVTEARIRDNTILNSGQSGIHLGGNVHFAAITGNTIETVNRDRPNPFGDENSVDGAILSYRPLYEGIKSVRGIWGDSSDVLIADNDIRDVANGIAIAQGNARNILIEKNRIQAMQRGVRLEFGRSKLFIEEGFSFESHLDQLFVMPDNEIALLEPIAQDNPLRHGIFFPDANPDCLGCNIEFMESYGEDIGKGIAYYPFPIEFASYDACGSERDAACRAWLSNEAFTNVGSVYLPTLGANDYQHPNAPSLVIDDAARVLADALRQRILNPVP